jgi:hypothetical protein
MALVICGGYPSQPNDYPDKRFCSSQSGITTEANGSPQLPMTNMI